MPRLALWMIAAGKKREAKARKPIRKVSVRQQKILREFAKLKKAYLRVHPMCLPCGGKAVDVHHIVPRSVAPKLILEPSNFLACCRKCHDWIKYNPAKAYDRGWLKKSV